MIFALLDFLVIAILVDGLALFELLVVGRIEKRPPEIGHGKDGIGTFEGSDERLFVV
jgi:hypothetical protein